MNTSFIVKSHQGDYSVNLVENFEALSNSLSVAIREQKVGAVVVDRNVWELYEERLQKVVGDLPVLTVVPAETEKTLQGIEAVLRLLQENGATTQTTVLAIGGGIIQDIVTFAAHIYYRGIKWLYVPTTLLGMSDSCIGAKCGINFGKFKNQLGVFHSPHEVWICSDFVDTLSDEDLLSGYGEILKLHLTGSRADFETLVAKVQEEGFRGPSLIHLIERSLRVKKEVIEADEYENDLRRILNYGHTFGHSLETASNYEVPHGIAIAWGMDCINFLAWQRGWLSEEDFTEIHSFIEKSFRREVQQMPGVETIIAGSRRDKKNRDGCLNLAILRSPGDLGIHKVPFDDELDANMIEYTANFNVFHRA